MQKDVFILLVPTIAFWFFAAWNMGSTSKGMVSDNILLERHTNRFSDVSNDASIETETLDTDVATSSLGTAHGFRAC
jgi:hypothetical protein